MDKMDYCASLRNIEGALESSPNVKVGEGSNRLHSGVLLAECDMNLSALTAAASLLPPSMFTHHATACKHQRSCAVMAALMEGRKAFAGSHAASSRREDGACK
jgi:hypothetical protein